MTILSSTPSCTRPAAPVGFTITPMHGPFMDLSTASRDWNDPGRLDDSKRPDYALVRLESINEGKPRQSGFGSAARNLLGKRRSGLVGGRNCPIGALGWSSFAGPSRCQDVQNTIRTKARRRCRSNCLEQWVERKVNSPAASAKRASRAPRWIALIFPIGGILLLDSKQIIRAVFLRLQHAILVSVLKRYAV